MRPNESGTTRVSMSRTIASLNDLRIFVTRSSADSITFDTIRKRSKPCFIPFFKMDVELFMRTYIGIILLIATLIHFGVARFIQQLRAYPQGSLKTGQSGSLQNRPRVKARDIDSDGSPYRLTRHEQCLERRTETTRHRTGKARMVFTKDRARNRCTA